MRQVQRMCANWLRHVKSYEARDEDLDGLPKSVGEAYKRMAEAATELHAAIERGLPRAKQTGSPRKKK